MSLIVLCPSRGRPVEAAELAGTFEGTIRNTDTHLRFLVDDDDPLKTAYPAASTIIISPPPGSMAAALNVGAQRVWDACDIVGFVGDDHRFRTAGWDQKIAAVMPAIAYGDDLAQRENLPTAVFMDANFIRRLGWMALPGAKHLFLDDTWKTLGELSGTLRYLPTVVIEHLHPAYGKGVWDEGHIRVNSAEIRGHDYLAYQRWMECDMSADVARMTRG